VFDTLWSQICAVLVVVVGVFAFLKGDEPERGGAGAFLLGWFASLLVQRDGDAHSVQWGMFAIDALMLGVLGALIWKARRTWSVWACALQLLVVMSYVIVAFDLKTPIGSFYWVVNIAGYGILVAIAVGTFIAWQERRAAGLE
jgi:hypothetical protein